MDEQINVENIKNKIYEIRGHYVMLDSDIAKICRVETKRINEAVRNNTHKFNSDHYFMVEKEEIDSFLVENFDQKIETRGGRYKNPRVFTEAGIEVLSTILKSKMSPEIVNKIKEAFHSYKETNYTLISPKKPENIEKMIYEIRGHYVMLDSDLAILYQCANGTKDINKAVKRNTNRFPNDFYFQLTKEEYQSLRFQIGTLENKKGQYAKYLPHVFTEEGVAMLSAVLRTPVAAEVSVSIMRAFIVMRHYIMKNKDIYLSINNINNRLDYHEKMIIDCTSKIDQLFNKFDQVSPKEITYYKGEVYDASSSILKIWRKAKTELIIIDAYIDESVLDKFSKLKVQIIVLISQKGRMSKTLAQKYQQQYKNLKIIYNEEYHDRYFILDREVLYHCGASINYAGTKVFSISEFEDIDAKKVFINKIAKIIEESPQN